MKKILIIALILVFALQLMPFTASAADAPTQLWVEPSDTNGIPARIDVFKMKTGSTSTTYTYQVYLPGNAVPANCFLSWDGGATVTINGTPYESGACPLPQVGTETTYDFKNGNQSLASLKIVVYQGSPNVQSVFIEINESLGTIAAMDNDINHNTVCSGTIFINGVQYELTKMKGRGNATWTGSEDKKPYNITLGKKINFPGINSEKTKKWSFLAEITDHSLLSNRSGYHLAYELGIGQDTTSADVWMNGEYQGCYTVTPKTDSFVTKNGFMIEQDNYKEPSVANGGDPQFSLEGLVSHVESSTWTSSYNYITVKKMGDNLLGQNEAGETDESPENLSAKAAEIQKWLQDAWDAIRSDDGYNSKGKYYTDYIDIESFAKMYLMHEYAKSYDVCAGSILFHRDGTSDEFKLIAGPMWDLDNAMGSTCQNSYLGNADDRRNGDRRSAEGYFIANISNYRNYGSEYKTSIYKTISKHADFVEEVNRQYNKYRSAFDNLENDVAQMISDIADSARMNHIKVNDISGTYKNVHKYSSATTLGSGEYRQTYLATTNSKTDWANYAANLKTYIHARSLWFYNTYYDENYVCVHEYDAVVTPPTCTAKGYTTYTCKYCGESYVDDYTPIIAHNYQDGACTVCGQTLLNVSISCAGGASVTVYETKDTTGPCMENAQLAHPRNGDTGLIDCSGDGQVNFVVNLLSGYTLESVTAEPEGSYNKLKTLEDAGIENGYRITKVTGDLTIIVKVSGTVTFNANGGTGEMEAQPVTMGEEATLPKNGFTRTGYTFVGWNTKADGSGTAYTDKAKVNLTENTVLYAQWKVDQHTITFDTAGGSEIAPITADYGTAVTAPAAPTKTGYTFSGWSPALPATMPAENMTVTAQWTINQYTLTFDTAGGSAVAPITADYGAPVTAPAAPTRTGYTFDGWDKAIPETMPAEDLTITAKWKINRYTITFDTAGGSEIAPITADYGTAVTAPAAPTKTGYTFSGWSPALPATMPAENMTVTAQWTVGKYTITFDTAGGSEIAPITADYGTAVTAPAAPTRTGYTFDGWDKAIPSTIPAEDLTITAKWKINRYTITFNTAGGSEIAPITADYGTAVTAPAAPTKTGYTFSRWSPALPATMPAENMTVTAQWTVRQYTITFDTAGGSAVEAITADYGAPVTAPAAPTRTGYTFNGWDKAIPETMPAEDLTITAKWKINRYTITFDTAGGSEIAPITADYGTAVTAPADPTKTGYTFSRWSPALPATMPAENMTVTAQWTVRQYTITFDTAGGSAVEAITADYGAPVTAPAAPTRTGYTFDGWDKAIPTAMPAEDLTITAKWKINRYTITFNTAGGSAVADQTVTYLGKAVRPEDPTKEGYEFLHWADQDGRPFSFETLIVDDVALTAVWHEHVPTITGQPENQTVSEGKTAAFAVTASGEGLSYQWRYSKDGGKNWYNKSGATSSSYTVTARASYDGMLYCCVVKNSAGGSVTSDAATLTVIPKAVITLQPADQTAAAGKTATFTTAASGEGLSYQWQYSKDGGNNWYNKSGATSASYTVTAKATYDGMLYRCKVTNAAGGAVYTAEARLTVLPKPIITLQPADQTAAAGKTATFTAAASGEGLSYQWQYSADGGESWHNKTGATSTVYTVTVKASYDGMLYRCRVTSSGGSVYTAEARLTVIPKPVITAQPADQTAAEGKTAAFAVSATGEGLSYQWQYSKDGGENWKNKTGATSAAYTVTTKASYDGMLYRCKVTNSGGSVFTAEARLTVLPKPVIVTQPADQIVAAGKTATFTVTASGEGLSYQWQYSADGGESWHNKSGATSASYTVTAKASYDGMLYRCKVTNSIGKVCSSAAELTVK